MNNPEMIVAIGATAALLSFAYCVHFHDHTKNDEEDAVASFVGRNQPLYTSLMKQANDCNCGRSAGLMMRNHQVAGTKKRNTGDCCADAKHIQKTMVQDINQTYNSLRKNNQLQTPVMDQLKGMFMQKRNNNI